jgi:ribonuclease J
MIDQPGSSDVTGPDSKKPNNLKSELVFVSLGGLGEIGMNVYLYGIGPKKQRKWLMVDLGLTFPSEAEPGVDVVLPDLEFIEECIKDLVGIVITHAHEDHIGAVIDLWPDLKVPIYATPFTAGMLKAKTQEYGVRIKLPITTVPLGGRFKVGPFDIEMVTLAHSIPEPSGLAIRTEHGMVFHTGDWKLDRTPLIGEPSDDAKLQALGLEGVKALMCDSTNAMREGRSPSEIEIAQSLIKIIKGAKKRVAVTTFASNVARIRAVADAAEATGRKLVVVGRAMHRVIGVAMETGYLPADFKYLDQQQHGYIDAANVLLLLTGSQGESRAALARVADDEHPSVSLARGDLVIFSSRTIPGNEKAVSKVQNALVEQGVDVITDADALVHVTGHPRREELRQMYSWMKPEIVVPMHGEARHMAANAKLALEQGVPEAHVLKCGQMLRLAPGPVMVVDTVPVGRLYRDAKLIVPSIDGPVSERRKLSFVGLVAVSLVVDPKGQLIAEPDVAIDGVPFETDDGYAMEDVCLDAIEGTFKSIPPSKRRDIEMIRDAVKRSVRAGVDQVWGKKPIVKVLITVIGQQPKSVSKPAGKGSRA